MIESLIPRVSALKFLISSIGFATLIRIAQPPLLIKAGVKVIEIIDLNKNKFLKIANTSVQIKLSLRGRQTEAIPIPMDASLPLVARKDMCRSIQDACIIASRCVNQSLFDPDRTALVYYLNFIL